MIKVFNGFSLKVILFPLLVGGLTAACVKNGSEIERQGFGPYVSGLHARQNAELDQAAKFYKDALKKHPNNETLLNAAFSLAFFDGQRTTMKKYAKALWLEGNAPGFAKMILAFDALQNKKYGEVENLVRDIKGNGFESLIIPIVRAWAEAGMGDEEEAEKALAPLANKKVFAALAFEHKAYIQDYLGHTEKAEKLYREMISGRRFRSFQPLLSFSSFLAETGRKKEAKAFLNRQAKVVPKNIHMRDAMWRMARKRKPYSAASSPTRGVGVALLQAANELASIDAKSTAIIYAQLAAFVDPKLEEAKYLLGNLYMSNDQDVAAIRIYQKLKGNSPFAQAAREREAVALNKSGDFEGGVNLLKAELAKRQDSITLLQSLGDLHQNNGDQEKALEYYSSALTKLGEVKTENWILVFTRGIANEQLGHWQAAEEDFLKALELKPNEPQVLNYLGYSWIDRGLNIKRAKDMIEKAVQQRPDDGYIVDSLGWIYYLLEDYELAVKTLEQAVKLQPGDATINDHLGDAYWQIGRKREARFQWSRALILDATTEEKVTIQAKIDFGLFEDEQVDNKSS